MSSINEGRSYCCAPGRIERCIEKVVLNVN